MNGSHSLLVAGALVLSACLGPDPDSATATSIPITATTMTEASTDRPIGDEPEHESGWASITTTSTTIAPTTATTANSAQVTALDAGVYQGPTITIALAIASEIEDVSTADFARVVLSVLADERSWGAADFIFVEEPTSSLRIVLAEPSIVDQLCVPLQTRSALSCQNGEVVAINADRWRYATTTWDSTVDHYRIYLINHEVGHLVGQRHPAPRCPVPGASAAVMEQQTKGLEGCVGNPWPRDWELERASVRPATVGPRPDWDPGTPTNLEPG